MWGCPGARRDDGYSKIKKNLQFIIYREDKRKEKRIEL